MSDDLVEFLLARIDEDEQLARTACTRGQGQPEHWQWVATETDQAVPDADLDKTIEDQNLSLRSVEEYPASVGMLPSFAILEIEEVTPALPHIARWEPSRVLAECEAKRLVIDVCQDRSAIHYGLASWLLSLLALPYADHPEYCQEWRP